MNIVKSIQERNIKQGITPKRPTAFSRYLHCFTFPFSSFDLFWSQLVSMSFGAIRLMGLDDVGTANRFAHHLVPCNFIDLVSLVTITHTDDKLRSEILPWEETWGQI